MLNYVNRVMVGDQDGLVNTGSTLAGITRGDILILDEDLNVLSAPTSVQKFYVAVGTGYPESPFIMSSLIDPAFAKTANKTARAAADQVTTVTVPAPAIGDSVNVVIAFKDRLRMLANKQTRMVLSHVAETTAPYDLASALAKQALFSTPYSDPYGVKVEVQATATELAADNNLTVVKGSNKATFAGAATYNVTAGTFAAGDYIEIDGVTYQITEVDTVPANDVITLDRLYTGDSTTVSAASVNHQATITAVNLRITGLDAPFNDPIIDLYEKPEFEVGSDQSGAVVTTTTKADLGQGIARQIKRMEFEAQGYLGNTNLRQWPIPSFEFYAVDGVTYDVVNIVSQDEHEGDLQNQMKSPVGVTIAFSTAGSNAQRNAVVAILEDVLGVTITW